MHIAGINYLSYLGNYNCKKVNYSTINSSVSNRSQQSFLSNIYYPPINFAARRVHENLTTKTKLAERTGDFVIAKHCNIPCPACGKKMLNKSTFYKIADELSCLEPDEYLDYLGQYKEYMRPVEESVYNEIYNLSKKPGNSKDIRTLLLQLRNTKLPILQKAQLRTVNNLHALAKTLPLREKTVLENKINSLSNIIRKKNSQAPFRRKIALYRISKIKISNPYKYKKLQDIAKTFPTSFDMNSAWIVKYSGKNKHHVDWNSYDIALRFLSSAVASTDHIIAYSIANDRNDISNYMSMHNGCNTQKSNKTFLQWLNEDKQNRIKYMCDYFKTVDDLIKRGKITKKRYKNYVAHATQTIFEATKGELKLDDYLNLSDS